MHWQLVTIAGALLAFAAVSARVEGSSLTPAMFFTAAGVLLGADALGLVSPSATGEPVKLLAEATLTVVLFSDASRINLSLSGASSWFPRGCSALGFRSPLSSASSRRSSCFRVWRGRRPSFSR